MHTQDIDSIKRKADLWDQMLCAESANRIKIFINDEEQGLFEMVMSQELIEYLSAEQKE